MGQLSEWVRAAGPEPNDVYIERLEEEECEACKVVPPKGVKLDEEKPRLDLIPPETLENLGRVLTWGANKYGDDNWKALDNLQSRYAAAMLRHYAAWQKGEKYDPESGLSHTTHMLASAMFIDWKETHNG